MHLIQHDTAMDVDMYQIQSLDLPGDAPSNGGHPLPKSENWATFSKSPTLGSDQIVATAASISVFLSLRGVGSWA